MTGLASVEAEQRGQWLVLRVRGEVDISNAAEVSRAVDAAVPNGSTRLVMDLTDTTYLDSAGVKLLFLLADRLRSRRRELRLVVPPTAPIRAVLELTGLTRLVPVDDRFDEDH